MPSTPTMSEDDIEFVINGKESGLLVPTRNFINVVFASCGDGHRFRDIFLHVISSVNLAHPVVLNGGPLLIADNDSDPLHQGDVMIANIKKAIEIKKFKDVILFSHWPCSIAIENGLTLQDVLAKTIIAAQMLRECLSEDCTVVPKIHIDYGIKSRPDKYWLSPGKLAIGFLNGQVFKRMCDRKRSYIINETQAHLCLVK